MKELLGLTDGSGLVGGFKTLCVSLAPQITTHLPITAGKGLEDPQLGRVVGYGCDRLWYGQSAVPCRQIGGVVCCCALLKNLHEPSLHVVNLAGNQNQKVLLKNAEPITATHHHKVTKKSPKKSAHTKPQKSHI